jgi:hypothetical protein
MLFLLNPDLGPKSMFAHKVRLGWKALVANFDTLANLVMGAKDLVRRFSSGTELEFEGVDSLTVRSRTELGTIPEDWGTESIQEARPCCSGD